MSAHPGILVFASEVIISTEPSTFSEGMFSWFPLFLPLRHPVLIPDGGRVEVLACQRIRACQPSSPLAHRQLILLLLVISFHVIPDLGPFLAKRVTPQDMV